jgi:hypothetical protein
VSVVWDESLFGDSEILYRTSANNGNTFPAVKSNVSANEEISFDEAIAVS